MRTFSIIGLIALAALVVTPTLSAQNLLLEPGFEGPSPLATAWQSFGNTYVTMSAPPADTTNSGAYALKMFGNFNPGFDVTGVFQPFPCLPGETFLMSCFTRHFSGDPILGGGQATMDNYSVMKIAFFDSNNIEITGAAVEALILDGSSPTDTWIFNTPITATAPIGAVSVQALLLFLQPAVAGGAGYYDDVDFRLFGNGANYPGTNDDLLLATGISGPTDLVDVKMAQGLDWLAVNVSSPGTTFDFSPYFVTAQLIPTSAGVNAIPGLPELYLDLALPIFVLVDPTTLGPLGPPLVAPGGGTTNVFLLPQGLNGLGQSLVIQGLLSSNLANNFIYAITNAHEIVIP